MFTFLIESEEAKVFVFYSFCCFTALFLWCAQKSNISLGEVFITSIVFTLMNLFIFALTKL